MLGIERKNAPIPFDLSCWQLHPAAAVADAVSNIKINGYKSDSLLHIQIRSNGT